MYAWIIDKDHLATEVGDQPETGVTGPSDAPDWLIEILQMQMPAGTKLIARGGEIFEFQMRDDDDILYYTGRLATTEGKSEDACSAPLRNYGTPNAGCVSVTYPGHPDMDCS